MNSNGIVQDRSPQFGERFLASRTPASPATVSRQSQERVNASASTIPTQSHVDELEIRQPRSQSELKLPRSISPASGGGAEGEVRAAALVVTPALEESGGRVSEVSHDAIVGSIRNAAVQVGEVRPLEPPRNTDGVYWEVPPLVLEFIENVVRFGSSAAGIGAMGLWLAVVFSADSVILAMWGLVATPLIGAAGAFGAYLVLGMALFVILPASAIGTVHLVKKTIKGALWLLKQPARLINWIATQREQRREVQHENASLEELGHSHNRQQNCPISGGRLANPVISPYGITYSRDSISEVLRQQGEASLIERFKPNRGMEAKLEGHPVQCCVSLEEFDAPALSEDRSFPVVASDGHTYDYRTLVELKSHHQASQRGRARNQIRPMLSPVTKEELEPQVLFQWALMSADECQELARLLPAGATCRPLSLDAPPTELTQYWRDIPQP